MSIVVRYRPTGLRREQYDQVTSRLEGSGAWPPDGMDMQVLFGTEGDLRVSEIWDSEDKWRAFGETIGPVLQEVGIQIEGEPEVFEVHDYQKRAAATA